MPTALVTGANRGIGLELTRQYAGAGWKVFACARNPATMADLRKLSQLHPEQVHVLTMDVADSRSIAAAAAETAGAPIDHLINSAGVMGGSKQQLGKIDYDSWHEVLSINTMGPMRVVEAFVDQVAKSERKLIVAITSGMGSLADNTSGSYYAYRTSKAGVNMVMRSLSVDLHPRGISCIVINPGWVKTRMGGPGAKITAEQSVSEMLKVFDGAGIEATGRFFNHTGHEYPW